MLHLEETKKIVLDISLLFLTIAYVYNYIK